MAIREVLLSFTFEQQRQLINLIGVDVGDVSTLLTPTNEVVSGINEIVNGDVDLINQTHGMDDGTQASPSLYWASGQGFYKVSGTKLGLSTSLAVEGDLEVDGDITFRAGSGSGGTLTFGDLDTDNIVLNADVNSNIIPDQTQSWNIGSASKEWNDLYITGTANIDTLQIDENATVTGHLTMESGDIRVPSTQTTASIFDDWATTVYAFGTGTTIRIGADATDGETIFRNGYIKSTRGTLNLFNGGVTTLNAFGAATTINMGVAGSGTNTNFNVASDDFVLSGDLSVNGGEILSSQNTVDLFITQGDVRIGAVGGTGTTTIQNTLKVSGGIDVTNSATAISIKDNEASALEINEGSTTYLRFTTTNAAERIIVYKDLYVVGNLDISGTTTTIDATNLSIEDKNIELGVSAAPSDATADGGGITLKATTDKTISYSNSTGSWDTNIGFRVNHANNAGSDQLLRLGNANNTGTNSAHLLLANGYYLSPTDVDGTGAAFKIDSAGIIQTNVRSAGNITLDSTAGFTSPKIVLAASTGTATFGPIDVSSSTGYGTSINIAANAGDVRAQCQQTASQYTQLYGAYMGSNLMFSVAANGTVSGESLTFLNQSSSSVSNVVETSSSFNHYEQGTFAPYYSNGITSPTYAFSAGEYIRIGKIVHFYLTISATGTNNTDPIGIMGLPYNPVGNEGGSATFTYNTGLVSASSAMPNIYVGSNGLIRFYSSGSGNSWLGNSGSGLSGAQLYIGGHYMCS